jgi:hypothetical protein
MLRQLGASSRLTRSRPKSKRVFIELLETNQALTRIFGAGKAQPCTRYGPRKGN